MSVKRLNALSPQKENPPQISFGYQKPVLIYQFISESGIYWLVGWLVGWWVGFYSFSNAYRIFSSRYLFNNYL